MKAGIIENKLMSFDSESDNNFPNLSLDQAEFICSLLILDSNNVEENTII